jgi:hypothetical protein
MEMRAPVSRMERAVSNVDVGTREDGIKALEWRRAILAAERSFCAEDGSVWRACWSEWRKCERSGEELCDEIAEGILEDAGKEAVVEELEGL